MAGSVNKCILIGNLCADPSTKSFQNGGKVCNLRVATNESWKDRAIGLRSIWRAERIEGQGGKALSHYAKTQPARVIAFIEQLAADDVKAGIRSIPGFNIVEDKVVA